MSNIVLNELTTSSVSNDTIKQKYIYKDIHFDLDSTYSYSSESEKQNVYEDIKPIYDIQAVLQSLKNIFSTLPGEKILNPHFGISLGKYLFEPVTKSTGYIIGSEIRSCIMSQEPRVSVDKIKVVGIPDQQEYIIDLQLSIPSLNARNISLSTILNNNGFIINTNNQNQQ